jgi:hypothetical protein
MRSEIVAVRPALLCALIPLLGCAGASVVPEKESWDSVWKRAEAPPPPTGTARPVKQEYVPPLDCERQARALRSTNRDQAWAALKGCVARGRFVQLRPLVKGWTEDLRERPDAPQLLAQVIAARGGNVRLDVRVLRDSKIPIFTLRDCLAQPKLYEGRYVLLRGQLQEVRTMGDQVAARVDEHTLEAVEYEIPVGIRRRVASTRYGGTVGLAGTGLLGSGTLGGQVDVGEDQYEMDVARRYDNAVVETGRDAVLRIPTPDPFLENGRDLLLLVRFDGVRPSSVSSDTDEPEMVPVMTLVSYEVPDALVMD